MAALTLLITSPRLPAGLLSRDAWQALESAAHVLARDVAEDVPSALHASGITVDAYDEPPAMLARRLIDAAADGDVVWVGSPDADPGLTDALAGLLSAAPDPPNVEVLVGSWDPPGARLLDAVAVMDALRSAGGDPWSAQQSHVSLANYLLEEAHETVEAIEAGDHVHLAEELGDVLFQVLFHSRLAAESPDSGFDIDDVAAGLVDKLVRRNPHVFGDDPASTAEQVEAAWEQIKDAEKPSRQTDLTAGIPVGLSSLLAAEKVLTRAARRKLDAERDLGLDLSAPAALDGEGEEVGAQLLAIVERARRSGRSADTDLRAAVRRLAERRS